MPCRILPPNFFLKCKFFHFLLSLERGWQNGGITYLSTLIKPFTLQRKTIAIYLHSCKWFTTKNQSLFKFDNVCIIFVHLESKWIVSIWLIMWTTSTSFSFFGFKKLFVFSRFFLVSAHWTEILRCVNNGTDQKTILS